MSNPIAVHSTVAHQFDDPAQQQDAATFGMWVFLVTEIMFFGGLFAAYAVYRSLYPEAFALTSRYMDVTLGTANTIVLNTSSLTMALAVVSSRVNDRRATGLFLIVTIVLGVIFLAVKMYEYH